MSFVEPDRADGWIRTYCHMAGIIQCFFAAFFGRMFFFFFGDGQFYHPASAGKGETFPAYFDYRGLVYAVFVALLCITALFGGCSLVRLRPWVRRWEAAYLGVLVIGTADAIVTDIPRGSLDPESLTTSMLFFVAFAWLYLPFLFRAVVDRMAEVGRLPCPQGAARAHIRRRLGRIAGRLRDRARRIPVVWTGFTRSVRPAPP